MHCLLLLSLGSGDCPARRARRLPSHAPSMPCTIGGRAWQEGYIPKGLLSGSLPRCVTNAQTANSLHMPSQAKQQALYIFN